MKGLRTALASLGQSGPRSWGPTQEEIDLDHEEALYEDRARRAFGLIDFDCFIGLPDEAVISDGLYILNQR